MHEYYVKTLQESLLAFFKLRPKLSIIETSKLTEYAKGINEESEFIKKQRLLYNRKDKTWRLSYVLNQSLDEDLIESYSSSYNHSDLLFKTNANIDHLALLTYRYQDAFLLAFDTYHLKLNHHFNQLIELTDDLKIKSRSINKYIDLHLNKDINQYISIKDTKYSLVEKINKTSFPSLVKQYQTLHYTLDSLIYELFSIIEYQEQYHSDYEIIDGLSELVQLLSYDYHSIDNENVVEELKKQLIKTLPFEVHQSLVEDDCFQSYLNDYIKEFIIRKKDSLYLSLNNVSLDELEESDKGETYKENKYMLALASQEEKHEFIDIDINNYDFSMSILSLEKNIISFLKEQDHLISSFIYELVRYAYKASLTGRGNINKHGSAYNWAMYILRFIEQLYLEVNETEEEFMHLIKGDELYYLSEYTKYIHLDEYKLSQLSQWLYEMIKSVESSKDNKRYDSISRARNHKDSFKKDLVKILIYVQNEVLHKEKLEDLRNGDTYIDIMNMCYTSISKEEFMNEYIASFLKTIDETYNKYHLLYAYYLKHIEECYHLDIFVSHNPMISSNMIKCDVLTFNHDYDDLLEEWNEHVDLEELINIERTLIDKKNLLKTEYHIIHEMGTL